MAMTAAEHFAKAEILLDEADKNFNKPDYSQSLAARAQGHLTAARFLFDIEASMADSGSTPGTAAWRAGLDKVAEQRRAI